jgi:16S rRNA (adenine1518-N6/adenine1519-N6)-dimethyltransferase
MVRPKKSLGQHFLRDDNIAKKIVHSLNLKKVCVVLEIGPGTGILTRHLLNLPDVDLFAIEIDRESVAHLRECFPELSPHLIEGDFLNVSIDAIIHDKYSIIGNFPYNISSQILFRILQYRDQVEQVVCMLQKEVAERISSGPGNKKYGILSVLLQAFYDIEFLFSVSPGVFVPRPKIMSGVIRLTRNGRTKLDCDEDAFIKVVRQGFNNRRKTLRNALKNLNLPAEISTLKMLDDRAEQLSVQQFIELTLLIGNSRDVRRV